MIDADVYTDLSKQFVQQVYNCKLFTVAEQQLGTCRIDCVFTGVFYTHFSISESLNDTECHFTAGTISFIAQVIKMLNTNKRTSATTDSVNN